MQHKQFVKIIGIHSCGCQIYLPVFAVLSALLSVSMMTARHAARTVGTVIHFIVY